MRIIILNENGNVDVMNSRNTLHRSQAIFSADM